jgi:hypothetical protein
MAPFKMVKIPEEEWKHLNNGNPATKIFETWKSSRFLVQIRFHGNRIKLCVNKVLYTKKNGKIHWQDGITWDELQEIKNQVGYKDFWLCEYFPPQDKVVNIANIRHLWLLDYDPVDSLTSINGMHVREIQ